MYFRVKRDKEIYSLSNIGTIMEGEQKKYKVRRESCDIDK